LCKKPLSNLFTKRLRGASLLEENKLDYLDKNINIERLFSSAFYYPALIFFSFLLFAQRPLSNLLTKRLRGASLLEENKLNYLDINIEQFVALPSFTSHSFLFVQKIFKWFTQKSLKRYAFR